MNSASPVAHLRRWWIYARSNLGSHRRIFAAMTVILLAAFGFFGLRGIWEPDEGRYVAVALQMLWSGDWMHPALSTDHPHLTKPPFTYWCIAASIKVLGPSETAARLPVALSFASTAVLVGLITRKLAPGRGVLASMMYAVSPLAFVAGNIVTTDTLVTMWEVMAVLGFVIATPMLWNSDAGAHGRESGDSHAGFRPRLPGLLLMWGAFGMGFFTKGPPSLLPLLAILIAVIAIGGWRSAIRLFHPLPVGMFILIAGWWYAAIVLEDPDLLEYFIVGEVYDRIFTDAHGRNPEWYHAFMFLPLLIGGVLPWSLRWVFPNSRAAAARFVCGRWREDPITLFLLSWVGLPLIVFMMAQSRLSLYVVPLIAPLIILTARLHPVNWLASRDACSSISTTLVVLLSTRIFLGVAPIGRDARTFASEISVPKQVVEIVYVDIPPAWGVRLYTGLPVGRVRLTPGTTIRTLDVELSEERDPLLLITDETRNLAVQRTVESNGWTISSSIRSGPYRYIHITP